MSDYARLGSIHTMAHADYHILNVVLKWWGIDWIHEDAHR